MDPFTCLSLATSIIQIVDFGFELVGKGHKVYKNGSIASIDEARIVANNLKGVAETISHELNSVSILTPELTDSQLVIYTPMIDSKKFADCDRN
jgi:hypothetical protein